MYNKQQMQEKKQSKGKGKNNFKGFYNNLDLHKILKYR